MPAATIPAIFCTTKGWNEAFAHILLVALLDALNGLLRMGGKEIPCEGAYSLTFIASSVLRWWASIVTQPCNNWSYGFRSHQQKL